MSRTKVLLSELNDAQAQINSLINENKMLKMVDKRLEIALSKYEGTHAQLPLIIKTYGDDIRSLKTRLRRMKGSYRELENAHRSQSDELTKVKLQHKHLLDLSKNKQLADREKLACLLEEAENMIKQQETKSQNLIKKIELQNKIHRSQISAEMSKTKLLQAELNHVKKMNEKLEAKVEKLKYQGYSARRVWGANQSPLESTTRSKESVISGAVFDGRGDQGVSKNSVNIDDHVETTNTVIKSLKPELVHGESEISDHTKDLQKNLMKQVHEDIINKPDMLINDKNDSSNFFGTTSILDHGISELIKEKYILDGFEENFVELDVTENPYSLTKPLKSITDEKHQFSANSSAEDEVMNYADKTFTTQLQRDVKERTSDDDDDDVSSISSVSDSD